MRADKKSMLPQIFFLIGIFSLTGCGENASEQSVRKWNEQEKQRAAEIEAGRIDTTAARAEMTYCQTNRDQILTSAKSNITDVLDCPIATFFTS